MKTPAWFPQALTDLVASLLIVIVCAVLALTVVPAWAQQNVARTQRQTTQEATSQSAYNQLDERDKLLGQIWGLSDEEMMRAKVLLEGPRKSFSVANLSPVEALGIHARSDAERRKYAEAFARALHADVERSLAWNQAFTEAMARLYPNEAVVDYSGAAPVAAPVGAADALGVPRRLILDAAPSSARPGRSTAARAAPGR